MKILRFLLAGAVVLSLAVSALAQEISPVPKELTRRVGRLLLDAAGKIDKPQVKIEGDPEHAVALAVPMTEGGVLLAPQKGLDEENMPDMTGEKGVPLGLLFAASNLVPVVDGKPIDRQKLHTLTVTIREKDVAVNCLLLSVRQISEDDYRLYVFGKGAKPLIDAKFTSGEGPGTLPVALEIKNGDPAMVVITVFGRYQAKFPGTRTE